MKSFVKRLARKLLGDYAIYFIYSHDAGQAPVSTTCDLPGLRFRTLDEGQISSSRDPLISRQVEYCGTEAHVFGCLDADRIIAACFYWFGERYRKRNFWQLADDEAKLVQLVTVADMRGRGVASGLITFSSREMHDLGFGRLYARIWHSNHPSLMAFSKAGWRRVALVLEIAPLGHRRAFRIRWMGRA